MTNIVSNYHIILQSDTYSKKKVLNLT